MSSLLQVQKELFVDLKMSAVKGDLIVNTLRGSEALSELFEFQVSFSSPDRNLDADKILGTSATVRFKSEKLERFFNGIVTHFSQGTTSLKEDIYSTEYFFTMRPKLWLLSLDCNCRMFQNKSVMDIIKAVLGDNNIKDVSYKTSKNGSTPRVYCVQYNESSFNFISRLMEDEGIFYYFTHEDGKHTLVITDNSNSYSKLKEEAEFYKNTGEICPLGKVFNTSKNSFMHVGGYALADYNYMLSQTKLYNKLDSKRKGNLFYEYPGGFSKSNEGEALSKLRVQEIECKYKVLQGDSTIPDFIPGSQFGLKLHHSDAFNDSYILYKVEHMFDRTERNGFIYRNRFAALPKDTEFRAPRKTPKPKVYGNQTAEVVCPSGKEIYRNDQCCIKVRFYWDQEKKEAKDSSCWIRVAQLMSGNNWGAIYVPRVGQEVVVSFLEGDPDRPLIVGCVYNDKNVPPYASSQDMISTYKSVIFKKPSGCNEIRFNDEKSKEEFYCHAEKDLNTIVKEGSKSLKINAEGKDPGNYSIFQKKGDFSFHIEKGNSSRLLEKGNSKIELKDGNSEIKLSKGNSKIELSKGDSEIKLSKGNSKIELSNGNSEIKLGKGNSKIELTKGNSEIKLKKGNQTIEINGNVKIKVKGNIDIEATKNISVKCKKFTMNASQKYALTAGVGGVTITTKSGSYKLTSMMTKMKATSMTQIQAPMNKISTFVKLG